MNFFERNSTKHFQILELKKKNQDFFFFFKVDNEEQLALWYVKTNYNL